MKGKNIEKKEILDEISNLNKEVHSLKHPAGGNKRYKIIYERDLCIGVVACVMSSPKYWEMDNEGKAILKNGQEVSPGIFEIEIGEDDYAESFEAAKECPVNCIHIINLETGEKII